jgi:hypothetical protein
MPHGAKNAREPKQPWAHGRRGRLTEALHAHPLAIEKARRSRSGLIISSSHRASRSSGASNLSIKTERALPAIVALCEHSMIERRLVRAAAVGARGRRAVDRKRAASDFRLGRRAADQREGTDVGTIAASVASVAAGELVGESSAVQAGRRTARLGDEMLPQRPPADLLASTMCSSHYPVSQHGMLPLAFKFNSTCHRTTVKGPGQGASLQTPRINSSNYGAAVNAQRSIVAFVAALAQEELRARGLTVEDPRAPGCLEPGLAVLVKEPAGLLAASAGVSCAHMPYRLCGRGASSEAMRIALLELKHRALSSRFGCHSDDLICICKSVLREEGHVYDCNQATLALLAYTVSHARGRELVMLDNASACLVDTLLVYVRSEDVKHRNHAVTQKVIAMGWRLRRGLAALAERAHLARVCTLCTGFRRLPGL